MKSHEIIAVIKNGLVKAAIRQISSNIIGDSMQFSDSLVNCLNGVCHPEYILLESSVIPEPQAYTLEKIKTKNSKLSILMFETSPLDDGAFPFISVIIRQSDTEDEVLKKLKDFLNNVDSKSNLNLNLTAREKEIVKLVALGKTNKEISDTLFISPHTVITHRKNITSKLGIKTIAGITVYAILNNLITPDNLS